MQQLPLNIALQDGFEFETFYPANGNGDMYAFLKTLFWQEKDYTQVFLFGSQGAGKSHLLQACCHNCIAAGQRAFYLPLKSLAGHGAAVLQGVEEADFLALDDVDAVAGGEAWDEVLFHLINQRRAAGKALIFAAGSNPRHWQNCLPDLVSRYLWGPVYQVNTLDDMQAMDVFCQRARRRGLAVPDNIVTYLLRHARRDICYLMELLDDLDRATLRGKQRLTLNVVREVMTS